MLDVLVNRDVNKITSVFSALLQAVLDTVRRASWGKIENGSFAPDLRFVHISRYAIKIPGEIV